MKTTILTTILTFALLAISNLGFAQINPIDFEAGGNGADWTWEVFENDDNPALNFITNPDQSGENTSATVAEFTARAAGASFAGTITRGTGTYLLDETNRTITIKVWKSTISDVGIKLETASNFSPGEIKVANTKINEWETLTFDFSNYENPPEGEEYNGVTVFPDFTERDADNTIYFDDITFSEAGNTGGTGDNILINGAFSDTLNSWEPFVADFAGVAATVTETNGEASITGISGAGSTVWHVQLNQILTADQISSLEVGESYTVSFDARSSVDGRPVDMFFGQNEDPFTEVNRTAFTLNTTMDSYSTTFVVGETFTAMKLGFEMGLSNDDVFIDNVVMSKETSSTIEAFSLLSPPDGTTLELTGDETTEAVIEWQAATAGGDITYTWHADTPGSDFTDPLVSIPSDNSGAGTTLTLTYGALDTALEGLGVEQGASITLDWTVTAESDGEVRFAEETFAITVVRNLSVSNELDESPNKFALNQNYPNPFNPTTSITYNLPASGEVILEVFNVTGQQVATLVNGVKTAGSHTATFDASNLSSGVYMYRLSSGNSVQIRKMLLIK